MQGLHALFKVRSLCSAPSFLATQSLTHRLTLPPPPLHLPQGAKLEVESIIREVCDRVLTHLAPEEANTVSIATLRKRAVALGLLGEVYATTKRDPNAPEGPLGAFGFAAGGSPPP